MFEENCKENVLNLIFEEKDEGWKEILFTWLLDIDRRGHPFSVCEKNVDCKGQVYFLNYDVKFKIVCKF